MMTTEAMPLMQQDDAELVAESLGGNQDAFRQIVERYQTLICSLAYCATGSVSQSEDLAQETFTAAWKQLPELREPSKLRSWLCGIVRFRVGKQLRSQGREPVHAAEPMEAMEQFTASEPLPSHQAISNEENALLWHSLERIPETYREPLVLFYREHQSVERVAEALDLSEDTVKQRLSRGRKLLQEEFLAFVEGALERTNPGKTFTIAVLATLPGMTISAQAATLGAVAKGGAAVKGVAFVGFLAAILAPLLSFYGMWSDYRMKRKAGRPAPELKLLKVHYFGITGIVVSFVLFTCVLMSKASALTKTNPALFAGLMVGLILGYALLIVAFSIWIFRRGKKLPEEMMSGEIAVKPNNPMWEYRSRFQLIGLPFIHIRFWGCYGARMKDSSMWKPVKAWIAVSDSFAFGVLFAYGGVAIAPISFGAVAIGLLSWGGMALGALAVGGFAFGIWALAPFAVGWQAFGDVAIAWNAAWGGKIAVAHHFALAQTAHAAQTNTKFVADLLFENPFFHFCRMKWNMTYMLMGVWAWAIPMMISQIVQGRIARKRSRQQSAGN